MKKVNPFVLWCLFVLSTFTTFTINAANLYWSGDGTTAGGTGTWDTTLARWGTSASGPFTTVWANTTSDVAMLPVPSANATITTGLNITNGGITTLGGTNTITGSSSGFTVLIGGANPTITVTNKLTLNPAAVKSSGTVVLTKAGPGQLQFNNNGQTFSKYIIKGGIISTANTNKWGSGGSATTADFITLDGGGIGNDSTSQNLNFGITIGAGGGSFGQFASTITNNISSKITGVGGINFGAGSALAGVNSSTYTAAGFYCLSNAANDYAGSTTLTTGTLLLGVSQAIPSTSTLNINGGTFSLNSFSDTVANLNVSAGTISGAGTLTVSGNTTVTGTATISSIIGGATSLRMNGSASSILTLSGVNTFTGDITNQAGWISLGNTATQFGIGGTLRLSGGNLICTANRTAANTIMNPVVVSGNTILTNATTGASIFFRSGGAWTSTGGSLTLRNPNGATGTFDLFLTNAVTFNRPVTNGVTGDAGFCQISFNNDGTVDQTFSGIISGNGKLRRSGSGGITYLTGANTYTGGTSNNSGYIGVGVDCTGTPNNTTSGAFGTDTIIQGGGGILASGAPRDIYNDILFAGNLSVGGSLDLTLSGSLQLSNANRTITVTNTALTTIAGSLSSQVPAGATALTKAGSGILSITSDNAATLSGNISVSAGTLRAENTTGSAIGTGNVNVAAAGTLGGNGAISGMVTNSGTLAPGTSVGSLDTGSEIWNSGSTNIWEINDAAGIAGDTAAGWDVVNINGTLTINATTANPVKIKITSLSGSTAGAAANFNNTSTYSWVIAQTTGGISGFDPRKFLIDVTGFANSTGNGSFQIAQSGNNLVITFSDPAIVTNPADVTVGRGSNAVFNVTAAGNSPAYQWQKGGVSLANDSRITGSQTASLTIGSVQDGDEVGAYSVIVTTGSGSVTSYGAALNICDPPTVTGNPANSSIGAGTNAIFSIAYTGTSNAVTGMTFRWKTNGVNLTESAHFVGTATPTLTVVGAVTTDAASYSVGLTNTTGNTVSSAATLVVDTLPVITTQPTTAAISPGDMTNFTIVATGPHLSYQWQTNNVNLVDDANYIGTTASVLTITNAIKANEAINWYYHCVISNAAGAVTSSDVQLVVATGATIVAQPSSKTVAATSNVTFTVSALGTNTLTYQWYLNNVALTDGVGHVGSGAQATTLSLNGVNQADAGSYKVIVSDGNTNAVSSTATLTVIDPPVITGQPVGGTFNAGQTVNLSVANTGTSPTYKWRRNGVNLADGGSVSGSSTANLTLSSVTLANAGSYTVVLSNIADVVTSSAAVVVVNQAPTINTHPANQVASQFGASVTFSVAATGNPLNYQWRFNGVDIPSANASSYVINSAQSSDIGYYSVVVSNDLGTITSSSATLSFAAYLYDPLDSNTLANWTTNSLNTNGVATDNKYTFAFDYSTVGVPACPGATTTNKALKLEANRTAGSIAAISLSPKNFGITGDYQLRFSAWQNAVGPFPNGGAGSTEAVAGGIGTTGDRVQYADTIATATNANGPANGVWFIADGDAQASETYRYPDYGIFINTTLQNSNTGVYASGTAGTAMDANNSYYTGKFASRSCPAAQTALFPSQTGSLLAGSFGMAWRECIVRKSGNVITWLIDGNKIASVTNATLAGSNVFIGYIDTFPSVAATNSVEFGLFANVRVEPVNAETTGLITTISSQPASITKDAGTTATFSVTATGPGTLSYQWQKNGADISGATSSSYSIPGVLAVDAGTYRVVITSDLDIVTSGGATLTVNDPGITSQPASQTVALSSAVNLSVTAVGTGTLTYQWRKGGLNLSNNAKVAGASTPNLTIANSDGTDSGSYDVVVTGLSTVTSSAATLVVQDPGILTQPASQTSNAGTTATFTVNAVGTGTLTYQWTKNASPLSNTGNVSGATSATLTLSTVQDADAASYAVIVTGANGNVTSANATLSIIDAPVITVDPASRTNNAKTTATFAVTATGTPPLTYQWRKNGVNLVNGGHITGATATTLSVTSVLSTDVGSYSVIVSNPAGSPESAAAILTVLDPVVTTQPVSRSNNIGDNANFSIVAVGTDALTYQWQHDGNDIPGATTNSYVASNITAADAGSYTCVVSNALGATATSSAAVLSIPYASATMLAQWNFNSASADANTNSGSITASLGTGTASVVGTVTNANSFGAGTTSDPAALGTDNSSWLTTNYPTLAAGNKSAGVQFNVSTVGRGDIVLTFEALSTSRCSKYTRVQYTTNGTDWVDADVITNTTGYAYRTADFTGLPGVDNNADFAVRIVAEFESTAIGSANANYVQTSGSSAYRVSTADQIRYDMVTVLANVSTPAITSAPAAQTANAGATVTLTGAASGGSLNYQWLKAGSPMSNGGNVAGANTATLTLGGVYLADAGDYQLIVFNDAGTDTSSAATLTVIDPVITTQPANSTGECAGTAYLNVVATGTGPFTYQWYTPDASGSAISGAQSDTLTVNNVSGVTTYAVVVSGPGGTATSSTASLTAYDTSVPTITPNAGPSTICVGQAYSDPGATASDTCAGTLSVNPTGSVNSGAAGFYTLTYSATDPSGNSASATHVVQVVSCADPEIVLQPALTNYGVTGHTITLNMQAAGTGPFKYQWYQWRVGQPAAKPMKPSSLFVNSRSASLTLTHLAAAGFNGTYFCVVTNANNQTNVTTNAILTVLDTPKISIVAKPSKKPLAGFNGTLTAKVSKGDVTVDGIAPKYQWYFNDVIMPGETNKVLSLFDMQVATHYGNYSFFVTNAATFTNATLLLSVQDDTTAPPKPLIKTPKDKSKMTNLVLIVGQANIAPLVDISGTAIDKGLITNVTLYRTNPIVDSVQANFVMADLVTATNAVAGKKLIWIARTNLVDGTNTFYAVATDSRGNSTASKAVSYYFMGQPATLSVQRSHTTRTVSGVKDLFFGLPGDGATLDIGHKYKIKAGSSTVFVKWEDLTDPLNPVALGNTAELTFTMKTNMVLKATWSK